MEFKLAAAITPLNGMRPPPFPPPNPNPNPSLSFLLKITNTSKPVNPRTTTKSLPPSNSPLAFPMELDDHMERVLWSEEHIAKRVSELGSQISEDFKGFESGVVVVGVATGAFMFLSDLVKNIRLPVFVDFIRAESYGSGTESSGAPRISFDVKIDIEGKHVILVEDIVDTGNTLSCLISHLKSKRASSVSVCTFLDKPARRKVHFELVGEGKFYRGFECPDYFVVGYGMDFAELYRNLPYVGVLKPEMYK